MTEEAFRTFYELTARPVRVYLVRMTGDDRLADDLLQETYYRFLRAQRRGTAAPGLAIVHESDAYQRNYLFRIATNLARDLHRRPRADSVRMDEGVEAVDPDTTRDAASQVADRLDLSRAMARLKPRDRSMGKRTPE